MKKLQGSFFERPRFSKNLFMCILLVYVSVFFLAGCKKNPPVKPTQPVQVIHTDSSSCVAAGNFKTFTQGGWGAVPHGNNPGTYLHNNFASVFPNGLTVGCNYTIKLTTAQAVTDFLPQGGTPSALTINYIDPASQVTVLAGQLVALTLSVMFDAADPSFSSSSASLGSLVVVSGTFAGFTVSDVLNEANKVLGECVSAYSVADMNAILSSINENFDNGTVNNGVLNCTTTGAGSGGGTVN